MWSGTENTTIPDLCIVFRFLFFVMATFKSFEEIRAWQESRKLNKRICEICRRESVRRDFSFIDQITRSGRSISANIAEGFEALTNPEFITFLGYAKRSAGEVRSHLNDALNEKYISQEEFDELADLTKKICCMIAKLIHYLQSIENRQKRTLKDPSPNEKRTTKNVLTPSTSSPY